MTKELHRSALILSVLATAIQVQAGPLHDAVRAEDGAAIDRLLAGGADIDETDYFLGTALHVAVTQGDVATASALLDIGANIEAVSELRGARALHMAAQFGDNEMLRLLLDSGANIEARDDGQGSALFYAAAAGHAGAIRTLLERGAEIEIRESNEGMTALITAAFRGYSDAVRLLVAHGADINAADQTGRTSFRLAASVESFINVGDESLIDFLAASGADIHAKDNFGVTALAWAEANTGQFTTYRKIAEILRRLGATE